MVLTLGDLDLLKQLRGAGASGRSVRELNIRVTLDRLVKGGYLVGRPVDRRSVHIGSHSEAKTRQLSTICDRATESPSDIDGGNECV